MLLGALRLRRLRLRFRASNWPPGVLELSQKPSFANSWGTRPQLSSRQRSQKRAFAKRCAVGASLRGWSSAQPLRPVGTLGSFPRLRRRGVGLRLAPPSSSALCAGLRRAPPSARAGYGSRMPPRPSPPWAEGLRPRGAWARRLPSAAARPGAPLFSRPGSSPDCSSPRQHPISGGRRGPLIVSPACLAPLCAALPIACPRYLLSAFSRGCCASK